MGEIRSRKNSERPAHSTSSSLGAPHFHLHPSNTTVTLSRSQVDLHHPQAAEQQQRSYHGHKKSNASETAVSVNLLQVNGSSGPANVLLVSATTELQAAYFTRISDVIKS